VEENLRLCGDAGLAEELQRAKDPAGQAGPLADASTDNIAGELLERAMDDLPLDEPVRAAGSIWNDAEEIRNAFAEWIRRRISSR